MSRSYKYRLVSSNCVSCGKLFEYEHSVGMRKKICSEECRQSQKVKNKKELRLKMGICCIDGCSALANRTSSGMCETHFYRLRRTGSTADPIFKHWTKCTNGYIAMNLPDHRLSTKNGMIYQHRFFLYEHIGDGVHNCHWCKKEIEWGQKGSRKLVVDHLDGDKENNKIENLVQSCHACNSNRGLFESWVRKHIDDPFLHRLFEDAKSKGLLPD